MVIIKITEEELSIVGNASVGEIQAASAALLLSSYDCYKSTTEEPISFDEFLQEFIDLTKKTIIATTKIKEANDDYACLSSRPIGKLQ